MTSDSDYSLRSPYPAPFTDSTQGDDSTTSEVLDVMKRDRFELLSAYLDGEVTADERRQVETWLDQDATVQQLYQRLLRLRQGFASLPLPTPEMALDTFVDGVMHQVERRSQRRWWWSGGAIAAVALGALTMFWVGPEARLPQFARNASDATTSVATEPSLTDSDTVLHIALDRPIIEIPKAHSDKTLLKQNSVEPSLASPKDDIR